MALTLITSGVIKARFPQWEFYLTEITDDVSVSTDDLLEIFAGEAEQMLMDHTHIEDSGNMTTEYTNMLMTLIRGRLFLAKHGDRTYKEEERPLILREYLDLKSLLEAGRIGTGQINITARDRVFDLGFGYNYDDQETVVSTEE
jgi:hypothetical protein